MATTSLTKDGRARVLADGNEMPLLGLGVWQVEKGDETENSVRWALELGYRHIDTAQAYGPLNSARLDEERLVQVAERVGRTPAQVILRWCVQHDLIVIPKSVRRERIEENGQLFDFSLSDEDMRTLDELDQTAGTGRALERKWW